MRVRLCANPELLETERVAASGGSVSGSSSAKDCAVREVVAVDRDGARLVVVAGCRAQSAQRAPPALGEAVTWGHPDGTLRLLLQVCIPRLTPLKPAG